MQSITIRMQSCIGLKLKFSDGKLPEFFKDEDELRAIWSAPDTRAKLLLAEKGFGAEQIGQLPTRTPHVIVALPLASARVDNRWSCTRRIHNHWRNSIDAKAGGYSPHW